MKWKNKGHEFDLIYDKIAAKNKIYLFGAGEYGKLAVQLLENAIEITGFLDNDPSKQATRHQGKVINSPDILVEDKGQVTIVLTVSEEKKESIKAQLKQMGFEDQFEAINYTQLFHISGGEPLLYPNLVELMTYIGKNYRQKIGNLATTTNGTIMPKDEVLEAMCQYKIHLYLDDYREAVPQFSERFDQIVAKLETKGVDYNINKVDEWIDLAPMTTDHSVWSEEHLMEYYTKCNVPFREYRSGKLYSCNYSGYVAIAELCDDRSEDYYDLADYKPSQAKELIEFRWGYNQRGYVEFCKRCSGYVGINPYRGMPAKQVGTKK